VPVPASPPVPDPRVFAADSLAELYEPPLCPAAAVAGGGTERGEMSEERRREMFEELQSVDRAAWRREVMEHEELFIALHDHLPPEMIYERELLICRL